MYVNGEYFPRTTLIVPSFLHYNLFSEKTIILPEVMRKKMNHPFLFTTFWRVSKMNYSKFRKTERPVKYTIRTSLLETLIPLKINKLCTIIHGRKENKSNFVSAYK